MRSTQPRRFRSTEVIVRAAVDEPIWLRDRSVWRNSDPELRFDAVGLPDIFRSSRQQVDLPSRGAPETDILALEAAGLADQSRNGDLKGRAGHWFSRVRQSVELGAAR